MKNKNFIHVLPAEEMQLMNYIYLYKTHVLY